MRLSIVLLGAWLLLAVNAGATTYLVRPDGSGDFPTIQAAVNASVIGDVIELADGTFRGFGNRDVDYWGRAITIRSQSGDPETCVIDCDGSQTQPHRAFLIHAEVSWLALEGITVQRGCHSWGGAVSCEDGGPIVRRCRFIGNRSLGSEGGAVYCGGSGCVIEECYFRENGALHGGGASICGSHASFVRCTFIDNTGVEAGGGVHF